MKFTLYATLLHLKRVASKPAVWACLLLPMLLIAATAFFYAPSARSDSAFFTAGIVTPGTPKARQFTALLQTRYKNKLNFEITSPENAKLNVEAGKWQCSYILTDDFDARLLAGDYSSIFYKYTSDTTIFDLLFDQAITATLFEAVLPSLTVEFLASSNQTIAQHKQELLEKAQTFTIPTYTFYIQEESIDGTPLQTNSQAVMFTGFAVSRGIIALFLFLLCLLCQVWLSEDIRAGVYWRTAPLLPAGILFAPVIIANFLLMVFTGLLSLLTIRLTFPGMLGALLWELGILLLYCLFLATLSFVLAVLFYRIQLLYLLPFLLVACLLLSPIVLDISVYFPSMAPVSKILPPTLYLLALGGATGMLLTMLAASVLFIAAASLTLFVRRRFYRIAG